MSASDVWGFNCTPGCKALPHYPFKNASTREQSAKAVDTVGWYDRDIQWDSQYIADISVSAIIAYLEVPGVRYLLGDV